MIVKLKFNRDNKKKNIQLVKDRKLFEAKITELESKCNEEMKLKFGRIVDLEELEQVTVNRQVEELKEKLRTTEIECSDDLKRWEVSLTSCKHKSLVTLLRCISCYCLLKTVPCLHDTYLVQCKEEPR